MDQPHYLLFLFMMGYITYIYNSVKPIVLTKRFLAFFMSIPSGLILYIWYTWNWFLNTEPYNQEIVDLVYVLYSYFLIYVMSEYD